MPAQSLKFLSLSVGLGIGNHVLGIFSRNEVNRIWLSEPWLPFRYFWMEERHLNRGKGRDWHKLGAWNSGNDGIAIHRYLQSMDSKSHWGSILIPPKPDSSAVWPRDFFAFILKLRDFQPWAACFRVLWKCVTLLGPSHFFFSSLSWVSFYRLNFLPLGHTFLGSSFVRPGSHCC